jgi:hypothetical protein
VIANCALQVTNVNRVKLTEEPSVQRVLIAPEDLSQVNTLVQLVLTEETLLEKQLWTIASLAQQDSIVLQVLPAQSQLLKELINLILVSVVLKVEFYVNQVIIALMKVNQTIMVTFALKATTVQQDQQTLLNKNVQLELSQIEEVSTTL